MKIKVKCYSGYRANEYPVEITIGQKALEVAEIIDRWIGEDHRYFKVLCSDGYSYLIRHDEEVDTWEILKIEKAERDKPTLSN